MPCNTFFPKFRKSHSFFRLFVRSMAILYLGIGVYDLMAYEPAVLKNINNSTRYQFVLVDDAWREIVESKLGPDLKTGRFMYGVHWLLKTYLWGESCSSVNTYQTVRESWCPSSMVDASGKLYTLTFNSMNENRGPRFRLCEFQPNANNTVTPRVLDYNFWDNLFTNDHQRLELSTVYYPRTMWEEYDLYHCKNALHNAFSPVIAQEASSGGHEFLYILGWLPPNRYGGGNVFYQKRGLWVYKIQKSGFQVSSKVIFDQKAFDVQFCASSQPLRTSSWSYKLPPVWGAYRAVHDGTCLQLHQITNVEEVMEDVVEPGDSHKTVSTRLCYIYLNCGNLEKDSYGIMANTNCPIEKRMLYPRYQRVGNKIYSGGTEVTDHQILYEYDIGTKVRTRKLKSTYFQYPGTYKTVIGSITSSASTAHYQNDFCILQHNGKQIFCALGLKASATQKTGSYPALGSDLTATYGWDRDTYFFLHQLGSTNARLCRMFLCVAC